MDDDWDLLRQFAEGENQAAFSELVRRHVDFVYRCARRMLGGPGAEAEDVTQAVFLLLARKAPHLRPRGLLAGWLFNVTRHCCRNARKMAARRRKHEREAGMTRLETPTAAEDLSGTLDDALAALGTKERDAVLARFLEQKTAAEVAALLGISLAAAEKRTQRGLQKLRAIFAANGFAVPSNGVSALLASGNAIAVPATLAAQASAVTSTASAAAAGLAKNTALMMKATAAKTTAAATTCAILLLGAAVALLAAQRSVQHPPAPASTPVAAAPPSVPAVAAPVPAIPPPAATVNYRAVVRDENGKPVAGALVKLERIDWDRRGSRGEAQTRTAADGTFTLGPVEFLPDFGWSWRTIVVDATGYSWGWRQCRTVLRAGMPAPEIRVTHPAAIGGTAVDEHNNPIAGADVQLMLFPPPDFYLGHELALDADNGHPVKTDAQGHFQFNRIPLDARAFVKVLSPGFVTYDDQHLDPDMAPPVMAGQTHIRLVLHQGTEAKVSLASAEHPVAIAGVRVVAVQGGRTTHSVQTDDHGVALFSELEPGNYSFRAGGSAAMAGKGFYAETSPEIALKAGEIKSITLPCLKGRLLRGRLTRPGGIAPGTLVTIIQNGIFGPLFYGPTDADGRFETTVGPGDYYIYAQSLGGTARVTLDGQRGKTISVAPAKGPIDLVMQLGDVWHGRLVDEHGRGVQGFVSSWGQIQTRPDGRFELPIEDSHEFATAWSNDKKLGCLFFHSNAGAEHLVTMKPMGEISGLLKLPPGRTADEVKLTIFIDCGWQLSYGYSAPFLHTTIEKDGAFRIGPVPVGQGEYIDAPENDPARDTDKAALGSAMYVSVGLDGYTSPIEPTFTPEPGELQDIGTVEIFAEGARNADFSNRHNTVSGIVVNERGEPMKGLRIQWGGQPGSKGITDLDGHFELTHLPSGELTLWTQPRRGYGSPQFKVESPTRDLRLQMFPPAWKWYGKPAPELVVNKWVSGNITSLHDLRGHVVLLAVGSYGRSEPVWRDLKDLQQKYAAKGLKVVAVYAHIPSRESDGYSDPNLREQDVVELATDTGLIIAIDGSTKRAPPETPVNASGYGATDMLYGAPDAVTNQPLFVIDRKGILLGAATPANENELIQKALAE